MPPAPESLARENIDAQLAACGWMVQDRARMNLYAGLGVAVREFPLQTGFADYLLFVDRKAVGVIEAKAEGITLSGVAEQAGQAFLPGLDGQRHTRAIFWIGYRADWSRRLPSHCGSGLPHSARCFREPVPGLERRFRSRLRRYPAAFLPFDG